MQLIIRNFTGFLWRPVVVEQKPSFRVILILALLSIAFSAVWFSALFSIYDILEGAGIYKVDEVEGGTFSIYNLRKQDPVLFYWTAILFAPLIEELLFRLPLLFSRTNTAAWLATITWWIVNPLLIRPYLPDLYFPFRFLLALALIGCLGITFYYTLPYRTLVWNRIQEWWHNHFGLLFYLSSILFGLLHMTNYQAADGTVEFNNPIFFMGQAVSGLCLGYVRVSYGIAYSILLHVMINGLPFLLIGCRQLF